jgi:nucleotidyltransferase substrate binding protein (TIGR01987 family)
MSRSELEGSLATMGEALTRFGEILREPLAKADYVLDAAIQRFEFSIELSWKTTRRFLAESGVQAMLPRDILQAAYAAAWIADEALWLRMMRDRNQTSHTYRRARALDVYARLPAYHTAMVDLHGVLSAELAKLPKP